MPNIRPISDLRNYNEVLRSINMGSPVFLTKNGRGRYVVMDIQEYEKIKAILKLLAELARGEKRSPTGMVKNQRIEGFSGVKRWLMGGFFLEQKYAGDSSNKQGFRLHYV